MKESAFKLGASLVLLVSLAPAAHAGSAEAAPVNPTQAVTVPTATAPTTTVPTATVPTTTVLDEAQASFARAIDLYTQESYLAAAEAFRHTYELSGDTALLFNVAQCYRLLHDCDAARKAYQVYRNAEHTTAIDESWPVEFVESCGAGPELPAPPTPAVQPLAPPASTPAPEPNTASAVNSPSDASSVALRPAKADSTTPSQISGQAIAGWITVGAGAVAGGIALFYGLRVDDVERSSERLAAQAATSKTPDWKTLGGEQINNDGTQSAQLANVFTGAAAVLGATGVYLLVADLLAVKKKAPPLNVGVSDKGVFATWRLAL